MAAEEIPGFACERVTADDAVPQHTLAIQLVLELGPQVQVVSLVVVGTWGGIDVLPESDALVGDRKLKSLGPLQF